MSVSLLLFLCSLPGQRHAVYELHPMPLAVHLEAGERTRHGLKGGAQGKAVGELMRTTRSGLPGRAGRGPGGELDAVRGKQVVQRRKVAAAGDRPPPPPFVLVLEPE